MTSASASQPTQSATTPAMPDVLLNATEARALGCLIEKEFTTPDIYPLSLNSLTNACNQRNNRAPVLTLSESEVVQALDGLREKRLAALFSGADARVPKFRQTLDNQFPIETTARALLAELLLRGPQTTAELRARAERMSPVADLAEAERILSDLAARPSGPLVRLLPRQPGQKESRWTELLTGEPVQPCAPTSLPPPPPPSCRTTNSAVSPCVRNRGTPRRARKRSCHSPRRTCRPALRARRHLMQSEKNASAWKRLGPPASWRPAEASLAPPPTFLVSAKTSR